MAPLKTRIDGALEPFKPPAASSLGRLLRAVGRDVTDESTRRSCLVLAPHPDDETLGCAVTMMRRIEAGSAVHVIIASDGGKWPPDRDAADNVETRRSEFERACGVLGLDPAKVSHLDLPDNGLAARAEELTDAISDAIVGLRPDDVLTTGVHDTHGDHAALGRASLRAASSTSARLLVYPIWQWLRPGPLLRTWRVSGRPETVRTEGFLDRKVAAIRQFSSQLAPPTERSAVPTDEGLTERFVAQFCRHREILFPVKATTPVPSSGRSS
jgi:LmbE family N-acetylglucosaminyl deacetylase